MTTLTKRTTTNPFESLAQEMFGDFFGRHLVPESTARMNLITRDGGYDVEVAIPGFTKEEVSIAVKNGMLTISGERSTERTKDASNYQLREFGTSTFSRSVQLPSDVDLNGISARHNNGVLTVSVPTSTEEQKRTIMIE